MARIVILGAGLTGLSTAYHLEKNNFFDFKIFEKEQTHGGLARSIKHDGFTFDYTGHFLHCNNSYFHSFLSTTMPKEQFNTIARKSFIHTHNCFVPYPIQMNLFGLPEEVITECFSGFIKRKHQIKTPNNFREWVLKYFGSGFAKHFFFPYNEKLLCIPPRKIHPSWTGRFVPQTTIKQLVNGLLPPKTSSSNIGYNHHFYYPKQGGIQPFTDNVRKQIKSPIHTDHKAMVIDLVRKKIIFENGHTEPYETLITTIPLNNLLKNIHEPTKLNLRKQRHRLLSNTIINFNIGFKPTRNYDKHWVYIPEKKYPFYRVGFWHNFSDNMCPEGYKSFYGELAFLNGLQQPIQKITQESIQKACTIFGIASSDIITEKTIYIPNAYVIYDAWRANNLEKIRTTLQEYNIHSIGRYGEWKYASMQEAILDGKTMAESILTTQHIIPIMPQRKTFEIMEKGE